MPPKPFASPQAGGSEFTLAQRIIFKALCAVDAGKHEIAIALFVVIAEHFDWGIDETQMEGHGARVANPTAARNKE